MTGEYILSVPGDIGRVLTGLTTGGECLIRPIDMNDLTDERLVDPLSVNAAVNGVPVKVSGS